MLQIRPKRDRGRPARARIWTPAEGPVSASDGGSSSDAFADGRDPADIAGFLFTFAGSAPAPAPGRCIHETPSGVRGPMGGARVRAIPPRARRDIHPCRWHDGFLVRKLHIMT